MPSSPKGVTNFEFCIQAWTYLTEMAEKSGETCHASILDDGVHVMFIDRVLGTSFLKMDTAIGFRLYAHCTATGKAILAFQSNRL